MPTPVRATPDLLVERARARAAARKAVERSRTRRPTRTRKTKPSKDWLALTPEVRKIVRKYVGPQTAMLGVKKRGTTVTGKLAKPVLPTRAKVPGKPKVSGQYRSTWKNVRMLPVHSSNVASIGYDPEQQELYVAFLNGSVYEFYNVPEDVFRQYRSAPSKGKFHWRAIRDAYPYARVA